MGGFIHLPCLTPNCTLEQPKIDNSRVKAKSHLGPMLHLRLGNAHAACKLVNGYSVHTLRCSLANIGSFPKMAKSPKIANRLACASNTSGTYNEDIMYNKRWECIQGALHMDEHLFNQRYPACAVKLPEYQEALARPFTLACIKL